MKIRKLDRGEHWKTRALYCEVFPGDDMQFVDYYYRWKTRDNIIFAAEDAGGIRAMVHLNPFRLSVDGELRKLHYIVAVATQKEYRHQGLMRRLLEAAEAQMKEAGETLTFLMPAAEQIYRPFGYRFFGWQRRGVWRADGGTAVPEKDKAPLCRPVGEEELEEVAAFANAVLEKLYGVFVYRDVSYYKRLMAEQECQGGRVMAVRESGGKIIGTFCTAGTEPEAEWAAELRELILDPRREQEALRGIQLLVNRLGDCRVAGCGERVPLCREETVPLMMGKIPGGGVFESRWRPETVFLNEVV